MAVGRFLERAGAAFLRLRHADPGKADVGLAGPTAPARG